jgi:alpha-beta hydrolase superfamily lysophospholipase
MSRTRLWLGRLVKVTVVAGATFFGVRAFDAQSLPELRAWHREAPAAEMKAAELDRMTLAQYLAREEQVFQEVRAMEGRIAKEDRTPANRYFSESPQNPGRFAHDWNRTFELVPEEIRGGALLVHGMTDAPYSVRPLAEALRRQGYYALGLRMPGHGTVPAGLEKADWQDWLAAFRLGVRHVRERIGPDKPLVLVGYSNGGALSVKYSLDALKGGNLPRADRVVLLSPMIGVSRFARLSRPLDILGMLGLQKARWTDVVPEYNPFKYNSFPSHAARQSYELTTALDEDLEEAAEAKRIGQLPPILTFQSLADASVLTEALMARLYDRLTANGSEVVMFDLNREAYLQPLLHGKLDGWLAELFQGPARHYTLSLVTNQSPETPNVEVRSRAAETGDVANHPLALAWPPQVYSLSHVGVPFPPNDPLYGIEPNANEHYGAQLGALTPRGERGELELPIENLMRMSCNPFYSYMEERVVQSLPAAVSK